MRLPSLAIPYLWLALSAVENGDKKPPQIDPKGDKPPVTYALAGFIDIDGDGKDDTEKVRKIIKMNGGAVVAEIDATGKCTGELLPGTRYVVVGKLPSKKFGPPDVVQKFVAFLDKAENLGLQVVFLGKLLEAGHGPGSSCMAGRPRAVRPRDVMELEDGPRPKRQSAFKPRTVPMGASPEG